ncbi:hypothetical protein GGX14DRAFT_407967 [Mycena pura]|uniref:Uncharacterized protein n=1 Tax=Mycena pura TaxID=153505 RepID=A0AAD6UNW6_9AGAR|nr:hypothetical protein GGX14DRAFT_407967 [Mycena pura]
MDNGNPPSPLSMDEADWRPFNGADLIRFINPCSYKILNLVTDQQLRHLAVADLQVLIGPDRAAKAQLINYLTQAVRGHPFRFTVVGSDWTDEDLTEEQRHMIIVAAIYGMLELHVRVGTLGSPCLPKLPFERTSPKLVPNAAPLIPAIHLRIGVVNRKRLASGCTVYDSSTDVRLGLHTLANPGFGELEERDDVFFDPPAIGEVADDVVVADAIVRAVVGLYTAVDERDDLGVDANANPRIEGSDVARVLLQPGLNLCWGARVMQDDRRTTGRGHC